MPAGAPQAGQTSRRRLAVIGWPLRHTYSPPIQSAALAALGLEATYEAIEVAPAGLAEFLRGLRGSEWLGANVTVPHKEAVLPSMDEISEETRAIGAANTIVNRDGRLAAYNTDAQAFVQDLESELGDVAGRDVVILGAGGAARAVCFALAPVAGRILVWNRHPERALSLIEHFGQRLEQATQSDLSNARLLINCTSAGLKPEESPIPDEWVPEGADLYDLIYNPATTRLARAVQAKGGRGANGLGMLVR
ncbi:MAG TPA: shikimate dehydrogenase, partial [Chloroflexota bacterium]|nr:shikimate dehydrogenase [Chloroflexota bacterium]